MNRIIRNGTQFAAALCLGLGVTGASATPIATGQWYEFQFVDPGSALTACDASCTPGLLSVLAPDPAWTFVCPAGGCTLVVTDAFISVDRFELFDGGSSLGTTSAPSAGGGCSNDELACLADPHYSHGTFVLAGGAHSITGLHTEGIPGAAFFIVKVPEPGSLLLIGAGLLVLFGLRRRA